MLSLHAIQQHKLLRETFDAKTKRRLRYLVDEVLWPKFVRGARKAARFKLPAPEADGAAAACRLHRNGRVVPTETGGNEPHELDDASEASTGVWSNADPIGVKVFLAYEIDEDYATDEEAFARWYRQEIDTRRTVRGTPNNADAALDDRYLVERYGPEGAAARRQVSRDACPRLTARYAA